MTDDTTLNELHAAINDAWLGKVELNLGTALSIEHNLAKLQKIALAARTFQQGPPERRFRYACILSDLLDAYYGPNNATH